MIHDVVSPIWIIKSGHCIAETRFFQHHNLFWCETKLGGKKMLSQSKMRPVAWVKTKAKYFRFMLKIDRKMEIWNIFVQDSVHSFTFILSSWCQRLQDVLTFHWANHWYISVTKTHCNRITWHPITGQHKIKFFL